MRIKIIIIVFLSIVGNAFGQKEFTFLPKWKVGDKRVATIVQHETEYENGKIKEDTTITLYTEVSVLAENADYYTINIKYENIALRVAVNFYEKLGDELTKYKNLNLKYQVNKRTGKSSLINWRESQKFMKESFGQIHAVIKKKVPDMAGFAKLAFMPIEDMFKSKENIESYMSNEVGYLLFPYDKKMVVGDTLRLTESCANPFNPMDTITQTTLAYLKNIDQKRRTCDINTTDIYDLTKFKELMKTMMENMMKSFGAPDSIKTNKDKEIDSFDFDVSNLTVITFDYKATWPVKVVKTGKVTSKDPKMKKEKLVATTVTIK